MKKQYATPTLDILLLDFSDIITASVIENPGVGTGDGDSGMKDTWE